MSRPYQSYTIGSNSAIKRFSHHKRFEKALNLCIQYNPSSLLDVGTGDGYFLTLVHQALSNISVLHATEPEHFEEAATIIAGIPGAQLFKDWEPVTQAYDVISCQEVLEHLQDHILAYTLDKMKAHLSPEGCVIVSVPVETGIAGLFKNIVRFVNSARHRGTTMSSVIRSAFGLPVQRIINPNGYISSHIGFRLKPLEKAFAKAGLSIVQQDYSPLPFGGVWMNSQKIYVLKAL